MDITNQDVLGEKCVKNDAGELSLSDDEKMKAWVEHYVILLKVEFEWPNEIYARPSKDAVPQASLQLWMLQAAGEEGVDLAR